MKFVSREIFSNITKTYFYDKTNTQREIFKITCLKDKKQKKNYSYLDLGFIDYSSVLWGW